MNIRAHNGQLLALWDSAEALPQKYSNRVVFVWVILIYINLIQITIITYAAWLLIVISTFQLTLAAHTNS